PVLHGQPKNPSPSIPRELTSYRDVVKRVLPAVVSLEARPRAKPPGPGDEAQKVQPGDAPKPGFGSGVLVDSRGVVLTAFHLVDGAEVVAVHLLDGRTFESKDVRGDRKTDLAVVLLDTKAAGPLPALALGDSDAMEIGDRVLAVGAPFGLAGSVTHGIISGNGRSGLELHQYHDFLHHDRP